MSKPIIEAVKEYLETCPELGELAKVRVDFLDKNEGGYSVEETPANPVIRNFVDGSRECQFPFIFASRNFYATDASRENIDNLHLYEKLSEWIDSNNRNGIFPDLGEGREVETVEITTAGYLFGVNDGQRCARYQIQCRLIYKERKNNYV